MNKKLVITRLLLLTVLLVGCKQVLISEENISRNNYVLAAADGNYELTLPAFYAAVAGTQILSGGGILERQAASQLLDSILVDTLVGMRADRVDLRENYDYYFRCRESTLRALIDAYYKHAIFSGIRVDSQEAFDYFSSHQEEFREEEQIQVHHIVTTTYGLKLRADSLKYKNMSAQELETAARELTAELRSKINSKESFMEIAKAYSHDDFSAKLGGLIPWAPRGYYAWPFDSVAFGAKVGEIVGPYRDKDGWQILYVQDYKPGGIPEINQEIFNKCLSAIAGVKSKEISNAIFDTLFDDIEINYNEDMLDTNSYLVDKMVWAGIVNGVDTIDFGELSSTEELIRKKYKIDNSTSDMKKEMMRFLARNRVMAQTARSLSLDTLTIVKQQIANVRHYYGRLLVESKRNDFAWEPTEAQMRKYYDEHSSQYIVAKPLKVQHILVTDSTLAAFVSDQAGSGIDFMQLAEEYYVGEKSVRRDLANLGFIGPEDVAPEFFKAARSVRVNEVSQPVKPEYGYHIIKVLENNWSIPFENARADIRATLKKEHETEENETFKSGLFKEFNVKKTGRISPMHFRPSDERKNVT
ncbi:MAG TPA: peptidylprolyl isomerase [candidate division Zixibacteria bacterium]|nr:peptidylprolyl isomerase [candidate division Zixibacteria bacterium]